MDLLLRAPGKNRLWDTAHMVRKHGDNADDDDDNDDNDVDDEDCHGNDLRKGSICNDIIKAMIVNACQRLDWFYVAVGRKVNVVHTGAPSTGIPRSMECLQLQ